MIKSASILLLLVLYGCNNSEPQNLNIVFNFPNNLDEVSGIAFSSDKFIYTIQDSGNNNEIIVLDTLGTIIRKKSLPNIRNNDWEDLTFDKNENLYIGDFGNNDNIRKDLAIYKIDQAELKNEVVAKTEKISFEYPEQTAFPRNKKNSLFDVEAFFEFNNHFYLFTKNRSKNFDGSSYVYRIPNSAGHHQAQLIDTIKTCENNKTCAITSAAISPNNQQFVLLTHTSVWLFENFRNDFKEAKIREIPLNHNSQKEAICFKNENELFIAEERVKKNDGMLYKIKLTKKKEKKE